MIRIAVLTFVSLLLLLVSCESNNYKIGIKGEDLYPQQEIPNLSNDNSVSDAGSEKESELTLVECELHQAMLQDFDILIQLMDETFQYFNVVERKLRLDVDELIRDTRVKIETYPHSMYDFASDLGIAPEDIPPMDEQILWGIIEHDFFVHFRDINAPMSLSMAHLGVVFYESFFGSRIPVLRTSESNRTYVKQRELFETLPSENPALFRFIFRSDPEFHDNTLENDDLYPHIDVIKTDILEEGRIAYLKVADFQTDMQPYVNQLNEFYEYIIDFDHLIIDITECYGGRVETGISYIMNPLWHDRDNIPDMLWFVFFNEATLDRHSWRTITTRLGLAPNWIPMTELMTVEEILEIYPLQLRNTRDFSRLSHGFVLSTSLHNIKPSPRAPHNFPFSGSVWLLTSEKNYSASAIFAHHAKYMGFATLVGQPVGGGITAAQNIIFKLPNSGLNVSWEVDYLTDQQGLSLTEFPTVPHYINRDGLNALDTVLILIDEQR